MYTTCSRIATFGQVLATPGSIQWDTGVWADGEVGEAADADGLGIGSEAPLNG